MNSITHLDGLWPKLLVLDVISPCLTMSIKQKVVLEPRVSPEHTSEYVDRVTVLAKTWTKGHWPLDDLWPHICWGLMCDSTQGSLCPSPVKIQQSMWIQWPFLQKTWSKGHWPLDDLWPHIFWGHMCDSTQGSLCPSPWKYIKVCGYSDPFCKNLNQWSVTPRWPLTHICWGHLCDSTQGPLCPSPMGIHKCMWIQWSILQITNQRSLTPRWPLTPHLLRSSMWGYQRIIVSKSHENTSKYVDTVTFFAKKNLNQRSLTLDDLWPHICWGHRCDSTQGSLCPSPMGIHQCMWIQRSIMQITTYIHILHRPTYYVQNQWSHSLFLNYVQVRQQK